MFSVGSCAMALSSSKYYTDDAMRKSCVRTERPSMELEKELLDKFADVFTSRREHVRLPLLQEFRQI